MSSRGATWRGRHMQRRDQRLRAKERRGQRNRRADRPQKGLFDYPEALFKRAVGNCRSKVAYRRYADAARAKRENEGKFGKRFYIYECPICGKWHLTTHPWGKGW